MRPPDPMSSGLPLLDEIRTRVAAARSEAWDAVLDCIRGFDNGPARSYAAVVRADPRYARGNVSEQGSSLPGFTIAWVDRENVLMLSGRHVFSRYAMVILLEAEGPDLTLVRIRTYAVFPGLHGVIYGLAVFGTGMHHVLLHRLLRRIDRQSRP